MLTHNHASFLGQAIASVQFQTESRWELLIGEDGSTDNTAMIASAAAAGDSRIQLFSNLEVPLGFHRNFARLLATAQAPYVAFLEGDDWWSEPRKLEMQLALLDSDPSLAFCGGTTRVLDQRSEAGGDPPAIGPPAGCQRLSIADLISAYSFHFSSVVMRRDSIQLPSWIFKQYCLDRPLYLLAANHGDAGVINAQLSVYRLHQGGVWAPLSPLQKALRSEKLFLCLRREFPRYRAQLARSLTHILWSYLADALHTGKLAQGGRILMMAVVASPRLRLGRELPLTLAAAFRVSGLQRLFT